MSKILNPLVTYILSLIFFYGTLAQTLGRNLSSKDLITFLNILGLAIFLSMMKLEFIISLSLA